MVAAVVVVAGSIRLIPRWPGLAHEVALPPLDFFADVRVLMARAPSTPAFVVTVAVALVARGALLAAILGFTRRRFAFAVRFYLAALVPAVIATGLDFSGRAILYAYLIWGGLAITIATFVVLAAAPWVGLDALHRAVARSARQHFRFGAVAMYCVGLAVIGAVWRRPGSVSQVLIVPLSAALTAITVRRLAAEPLRYSLRNRLVIVGVGAGVVAVAMAAIVIRRGGDEDNHATARARAGSLLLVAGVDTSTGHGAMFRLDPRALGYSCRQTFYYSYRGPGRGGPQADARCPIVRGAPYSKADTTRPLGQLTAALQAQLGGLTPPVVVVTHSQGGWIAWSALSRDDQPAVRALIMLAPFNEGLAAYPPRGVSAAGAAGGVAVRLTTDIGRNLGISNFDPYAPLARELQSRRGAVERLVARRLPSTTRAVTVIARGDIPLEPRPWPNEVPEACPGWLFHAQLPTSSRVTRTVADSLDGAPLPSCPRWFTVVGHAADAFGAPPPAASR